MEYLSLPDIRSLEYRIKDELSSLLSNKAIVTKPNSFQWKFLSDCVNKLFNPNHNSKFGLLNSTKLAQLKFEVEDKLRKFYLRPGKSINYVFKMIHKKELKSFVDDDDIDYPSIGGYSILIRDSLKESTNYTLSPKDIKDYIERVVTEAIETEFKAYMMLPNIIPDVILDKWFIPNSPAIKEIMHVVVRHKERGWILTNPLNPSTKRILRMKVRKKENGEVFVSTTEYWYLRWWNTKENSYTYPYRETNRQQYVLRKHKGNWKVYETIRPQPRTSIPHRRKY